ncbi:hypothetical protein HDU82_007684 [Entophlyctis luteolus]|nr:hypothetical protein HDU82_007684 [Entophlyctis luteolus]
MDESPVPTYALYLPTAILGMSLDSWMLTSILMNSSMISTSVEVCIKDIVKLWVQSDVFDNMMTAATLISFDLLLGTQLMLAMGRYVESKELKESNTRVRFIVVGSLMFMFAVANVIIYAAKPHLKRHAYFAIFPKCLIFYCATSLDKKSSGST